MSGIKISDLKSMADNRKGIPDIHSDDPLTLAENAAWRLAWEQPQFSAHAGVNRPQRIALFSILAVLFILVMAKPDLSVLMLGWTLAFFFTSAILFRCVLLICGMHAAWRRHGSAPQTDLLNGRQLPMYTIIVPLYREPGSVPQLMAALSRLDYPADRLDIKLVLEAGDEATFTAIRKLNPPAHFQVLRVPPLAPRTKPKACNYALSSATGEHVVIYDAEDIPDTDQLRKAASAFHAAGPLLACLQARLNFYNRRENWLTRQFTLEYSMWFDWLLPGLQALGLPIPLGGTSNHFRTGVLRRLGGWDAYNVTEDADLGLRLARSGYSCAVLDSSTMEEANCQHINWLRQRTRWQKGYMMTWFVHMRRPLDLWRQLGPRGFLGFQLFVGGTVALALSMPAAFLIFVLSLCACGPQAPQLLSQLNAIIFTLGLCVGAVCAAAGAVGRGYYDLLIEILFTPLYWGLTMLASISALWQLTCNPFYWEKTRHAISRMPPPILPEQTDTAAYAGRTATQQSAISGRIPPAHCPDFDSPLKKFTEPQKKLYVA
ncbi:MAG: glycosyltransferase [Alphaproteobacteria bacterium]